VLEQNVLTAAQAWRNAYDDGDSPAYQEAEDVLLDAVDQLGEAGTGDGLDGVRARVRGSMGGGLIADLAKKKPARSGVKDAS